MRAHGAGDGGAVTLVQDLIRDPAAREAMNRHIDINMRVGNLMLALSRVADAISSPQRTITKIVKAFSNGCYPVPVTYLELVCGHFASAILWTYSDYHAAHRDENHMAKPGQAIGCVECRHYEVKLARLRALKPGDVQHSRFRTRDSRGHGKGDLYVYGRDPKSPTGVHLLFSIEDTKEAGELLRALQASPLSPTEGR